MGSHDRVRPGSVKSAQHHRLRKLHRHQRGKKAHAKAHAAELESASSSDEEPPLDALLLDDADLSDSGSDASEETASKVSRTKIDADYVCVVCGGRGHASNVEGMECLTKK